MIRYIQFIIIIICIISAFIFAALLNDDTSTIHPFIKSNITCIECHNKEVIKININNPAYACSQQCSLCHNEMKNHHLINIKINENLSENLILSTQKKIMCITCHNPNFGRYDTSSWKAESLYEKIFKKEDVYKTYYLIKKNNNGQLCKICH